jgi:hypothetical protein
VRAGTPPPPEVDPTREARIRAYALRADRGEPLFGGAPPADVVAGAPAPEAKSQHAAPMACRACGSAICGTPRAYCHKRCANRWHVSAKRARDAGRQPPIPGTLQPRGRKCAAAEPPAQHGGYAQAVRDDPRDDAPSAPLWGSPLLRALVAGLRAAADVLDEALRADGGAA